MIRSLVAADLTALLAFCRATLLLDAFDADTLHRRVFREPGYNERYLLVDERAGEIVAVMLGSTRIREGAPQGWIRLFGVAPRWRNSGIAGELLAELEARLRADGVTRLHLANSAPDYFYPGIDVRYTPALIWAQRHGFTRSGEAFNMDVPLTGRNFDTSAAEAHLTTRGILCRRLSEEDRAAFSAWMGATWSGTWQHEALDSYHNDPVSTFIALQHGQICGFASYDTAMFPGSFGPMGTATHLRGSGIGGVLFLRCLADMQARGYERCEICWVGPPAFYSKVAGATINRVFWQYSKTLSPER